MMPDEFNVWILTRKAPPPPFLPENVHGKEIVALALLDFEGDGCLDIWVAEMCLNGENPDAKNLTLLGDGKYDILGRPYGWKTPRLDIWINQAKQRVPPPTPTANSPQESSE